MTGTSATLRYCGTSATKVREVLGLIRGLDVSEAREVLRFCERGAADEVAFFHGAAAELGEALGPVLWQLPPSLRRDLPRLRDFLALLPRGGRAAFEFRDASWHEDDVLAALSDAGAALCVAEDEGRATPLVATARFGYLRLRRPDYDDRALARWAEAVRAQPWEAAFVFFKHEDEARGPDYALRFGALAGGAAATP